MANAHHKEKFRKAFNRSVVSKEARRQQQAAREKRNAQLRAEGKPTAWEQAQHERAAARAAHPPVQQKRTPTGNIVTADGLVKPCCQAKSRITSSGRVKCAHLGTTWLEVATEPRPPTRRSRR